MSVGPPRRAAQLFVAATVALAAVAGGRGTYATAGAYPMTMTLEAAAAAGATTLTSSVTIRVDRLMEESRRKRVMDGFTHNGYGGFLNTLRTLPPIGTIQAKARSVDVRYAVEQPEANGRRLVLVADKPLFFLSGDAEKSRAGYQLTMVELHLDEHGGATGTMAGAARVKPAPDGSVILDDFAEAPVQLVAHPRPSSGETSR